MQQFLYDSKGRLVSMVREDDYQSDDIVDFTTTTTNVYDSLGRQIRSTQIGYDNQAGAIQDTLVTDTSYDSKGRISLQVITETGTSGATSITTTHFSYPSLNTMSYTTEYDENGDGTRETTYTLTRTVA